MKYKRTYLPTGTSAILEFKSHQNFIFGCKTKVPARMLKTTAIKLIAQWNKANDWKFELVEEI